MTEARARIRPGRASHRVPAASRVAVDRCSTKPLYLQLREELARAIAAGTLDPDAPLPSSRQLAAQLGLSRNTVNAAYQELIAEGLIVARPRCGLFVDRGMLLAVSQSPCLSAPQLEGFLSSGDPSAPAHRPDDAPSTLDWATRLGPPQTDDVPHTDRLPDWHRVTYPFVVGQPDLAHFPTREWNRALRQALLPDHAHASLGNRCGDGDDPLLTAALCQHVVANRGIVAEPDQILITMGSQHALHLLASALMRPGGSAGMEEPGFLDARHILQRAGAQVRAFPVDAEGLVLPSAKTLGGLDLLYLTPGRQHPTNATLSLERRRLLLDMLAGQDTIVIEDDYDSEPYRSELPVPTLKSLDGDGRTVYLGSFSPILAPGLRIGYLVADRALVAELRERRRYQVRHPPGQTQRALGLLIAGGDYQRIARQHHQRSARRREAVIAAVRAHLPGVAVMAGGTSLWLTGPPALDCRRLQASAIRSGVLIERGDVFFSVTPPPLNHFRLGFGAIGRDRIEPGIRLLADLMA